MTYSEMLPRRVMVNESCQAMDENGNRCENAVYNEIWVHSDPEISRFWFAVLVCNDHTEWFHKEALR